jgi:hypothetical protein
MTSSLACWGCKMAIRDEVAALYQSILGRPADEAGLNYFTNAVTSGAGTLADVARDMRASAEARGLLGGGTTTTTTTNNATVTNNAGTNGLLGGNVSNTANAGGMTAATAKDLVNNLYRDVLFRTADAGGAAFWENALLTGRMTPAEVEAAFRSSAEGQGVQAGVRQVPFGSQAVGGNVYQVSQMPTMAQMPSIQNAFQQSLQYQAALPYMIPQFNPAEIPPTYQQIAAPRQRLDISGIQLPQWLIDAAAKDEARMDAAAETDKKTVTERESSVTTKPPVVNPPVVNPPVVNPPVVNPPVVTQPPDTTTPAIAPWITASYGTLLGREPEAAGAAYWQAQADAGVPIYQLIDTIKSSPEALEYAAKGGGGLLGK